MDPEKNAETSKKSRIHKFREGKIEFFAHSSDVISKDLDVFYNPLMKTNRDLSIYLLNSIEKNELKIGDIMAGSGIRSLRFLKELDEKKVQKIYINDYDLDSFNLIEQNLEENFDEKTISEKTVTNNGDANQFMLNNLVFDYIDIDPFGSPNNFLDIAFKKIAHKGYIAVTATDTAPLCGTYPKTCMRKYYARPIRNEHMHEIGLRILIRKCQLIAAQFEKAATPIFSYSKDHYFRIFFEMKKSKTKTDEILKEHKYFLYCPRCARHEISTYNLKECCGIKMDFAGPIYAGKINNTELVEKMLTQAKKDENKTCEKFLETIHAESQIENVGFYDLHTIFKKHQIEPIKTKLIMDKIRELKHSASYTMFDIYGLKTDMKFDDFVKVIKD